MNVRRATGVFALVMAMAVLVAAGSAAEEPRTVLEKILAIMRQSGQITKEQEAQLLAEAEQEARQAQAERETARQQAIQDGAAALLAGVEKGKPFLRAADNSFRLELGGRLQADYAAVEDRARLLTGPTLNDRFLVRRARIELNGTVFQWIDVRIEAELNNTPSLNDGYVDFRFAPEVALRAGQFKVPFSLEELASDNLIDFVERSIVNELAPSRDVGASLHGGLFDGILGYDVGVFNGSGLNTPDTNNGKDVAGRVTLQPFRTTGNHWLKGLQVAGDFTWGDENAGPSAQGRTMARTSSRFVFFAPQPARGDRTRWGADLAWVAGPASLKVEYDRQRNERKHAGATGQDLADVTATGWYVSGTYLLTGEDKQLNGYVEVKRPFIPLGAKWGPGAWELALRYAELTFDSDSPLDFFDGNVANGITGGGVTATNGVEALTAGVNWYLASRVRYTLNWTQYWYDNALGTPFSCQSLSCSAAQLKRRDDPTSWELTTRIAVWF